MNKTNFYSQSHLERVGNNVRQQLLVSNVIATKAHQLGIQDAKVIELLDGFINEWIEQYNKNLIELKSLTGWILLDAVKRKFLNNLAITHTSQVKNISLKNLLYEIHMKISKSKQWPSP